MAKSKEQKKQEAEFRKIRGLLIDLYREAYEKGHGKTIERILSERDNLSAIEMQVYKKTGVLFYAEQIKKYKCRFTEFPLQLQLTAFLGWDIDEIEGLKFFQIQIQKNYQPNP